MADHAGKTPVKKTVTREGKTHEQTFWVSPQHHEQGAHGAERQRQAAHHSEDAHRLSSYADAMDKQPRRGEEARHVRAHEQAFQAHRQAADRYRLSGQHDHADNHLAAASKHGEKARALDNSYRAAAQTADTHRAGVFADAARRAAEARPAQTGVPKKPDRFDSMRNKAHDKSEAAFRGQGDHKEAAREHGKLARMAEKSGYPREFAEYHKQRAKQHKDALK